MVKELNNDNIRMNDDYESLYKKLGYKFKNEDLLIKALSHSSICYSRKNKCSNYQRLELLGDSVLSLLVVDMLLRMYKDLSEGEITKRKANLVCSERLAEIAKTIGIGEYIIMSKGEESINGRNNQHTLEDIVESITGAIYLDGGLEEARIFVNRYWLELAKKQVDLEKDPKTRLQEWMQKVKQEKPEYEVIDVQGTQNEPIFLMKIITDDLPEFKGIGKTKKETQRKLAKEMIEYIKNNIDENI